jgi:hypothetical protein
VKAKEIRESAVAKAEEILVKATAEAEVQAWASAESEEILAMAYCGRPLTVGRPNPALAEDEARCAAVTSQDLATQNRDKLVVCIAFMHQKIQKFFAQISSNTK